MERLKKWLNANGYQIADDATGPQVEAVAVKAISKGDLSLTKYADLISDTKVRAAQKQLATDIAKAVRGESLDDDDEFTIDLADDDQIDRATKMMQSRMGGGDNRVAPASTMAEVLKMAGDGVRVKGVFERFSTKRYKATNRITGQPVNDPVTGSEVEAPSQLDNAKLAVWMKWKLHRAGFQGADWTDTELAFLAQMGNEPWIKMGRDRDTLVKPQKAVLTSGSDSGATGDAIVPEVVDRMIVHLILLSGELFPFTSIRDIPNGQTVRIPRIGSPTTTWGELSPSTGLSTFDPSTLIDSLTAEVRDVACAIEVGNYLMSDTIFDLGSDLAMMMSNAMSAELDRVVAVGSSANDEPVGIDNTNGITDVPAQSAYGLTDNDLLNLIFGIPKVLDKNGRLVMTKTNYLRFRQIVTGVTGDDRRLYTDGLKSYRLEDVPVCIDEPTASRGAGMWADNSTLLYGNMAMYRVWRRLGFNLIRDDTGRTNRLNNTTLFLAQMRLAGAVVDEAAFIQIDDAPA